MSAFQAQCDSITGTLPHFSDRFAEMSRDTQDMAQQLEERMRFLEDGYEHLGAVAGQIPKAFQELATGHRKGIMEAAQVLEIDDKENESVLAQQLNYLKRELHSIAQERVVVDVFTRGTISRAKQHFKGNKGNKESAGGEAAAMDHDRARRSAVSSKRGEDSGLAGTRAVRAATDGSGGPSLLQTRKAERQAEEAEGQDGQDGQDGQFGHGIRGGNAFSRMTRSELMSSIILPAFGKNWAGGAAASIAVARNFGMELPHGHGHDPAVQSTELVHAAPRRATASRVEPRAPPTVRLVRSDAVVVPSMNRGLPEEIAHLKTGSGPVLAPYDSSAATTSGSRRAARFAKASADTMKSTIVPVAKALRAELRRNKADMETLRNEVHNVHKDMQAERVAARRVMRTVAAGLESHMASTEENIKSEVQAVVDGAFERLTGALLQVQVQGRKDYDGRARRGGDDEEEEDDDNDAPAPAPHQASTRQHQGVPASALKEEHRAHVTKGDPVHQFLSQQRQKIQYDKDGRKIVHQTKPKLRTAYDLDGHPVPVQRGGAGGAKATSPAPRVAVVARDSSAAQTPVAREKSPKSALSPRGRLVVDTVADAGSPRHASPSSSRNAQHTLTPLNVPSTTTTSVPAADAETFTDPATGTVYKVLGVSDKGHLGGKRTTGTGVFWGRQQERSSGAAPGTHTPAPAGPAAPATPAAPRAAGEPFVKTLSIYRPVAVPLSREEQDIQDAQDAKQTTAHIKKEVQSVQEYSLVLGPNGVAWQATKVPASEYEHPDVQASRLGGGGGPNPKVANFLRREIVPGDVEHPGAQKPAVLWASAAGAGAHTQQQVSMLTNALGVVESGGKEVVISGTTLHASHFIHDTHDHENQLKLFDLVEGGEEAACAPDSISSAPLSAPPRPVGLPHPESNVFISNRSSSQQKSNQNQYGQSNMQPQVPGSAVIARLGQPMQQPGVLGRADAGRTNSSSETPRALHGPGTLTSESCESYTSYTPEKTSTSDTLPSERATEDRAVRSVSMLTAGNLKLAAGAAESAALAEAEGTDNGTAEEVQTLESLGDSKDGGFGAFDDGSSDGGGEVKLSSSAIDDNSAVYTRPLSPRVSSPAAPQLSPQALHYKATDAGAEAGAAGVDTDKNPPLIMKPLQSPLGQKLIQVVPVLHRAVKASTEAPKVVSAQVAYAPPAVQQPQVQQASALPAPQEFATAVIEALRALTATVAAPPAVSVPSIASAAPTAAAESFSAEDMQRGIEAGIESGVSKVLDSLKKRAAAQRERDQTEAARSTRVAAATARAQRGTGEGTAGVGAAEAADAAAANMMRTAQDQVLSAAALPYGEVKMLDLGAKARPYHSSQKFVPLVSNIVGAQASIAAATLSIDSTSNDPSVDESSDTVEKVFANVRLAPGLESIFTRGADAAGSGGLQRNAASLRNSLQQSYIFAGGDVSSSDDWTEVGAGDGMNLTDAQELDDELDALAELSLRDDSSFVEALKGGSGSARKLAKSPPKDESLGQSQSAEDNEIENIVLY